MSAIIPFDLLIDVVRFKLYELLTIDGILRPDVVLITVKLDQRVTPAFVTAVLRQLEANKHIEATDGKNGPAVRLLASGIRAVERQLNDPESIPSRFRDDGFDTFEDQLVRIARAPASDRIVGLDHNSAGLIDVLEATEELKAHLTTGNDVGEMSSDAVAVAVAEVERIQSELKQPFFRPAAFKNHAKGTLEWIAKEAAGALVGTLALTLLGLIIAFVGSIF